MYSGDPRFFDSDKQAELGMEARSILKSIKTEESKLSHSNNITRSDHYYFRARHNYYKLSLLRLSPEERTAIEPVLARFQQKIASLEEEVSRNGETEKVTPFLAAVEPQRSDERMGKTDKKASASADTNELDSFSTELVSQLSLIRLALSSDLSASSKQVIIEGLDRVISRLEKL